MYTSKILLIFFIFLAVFFSLINMTKAIVKNDRIPAGNFILQAIGITGIIAYFIK